ncbi:hypothetical protein ES702_06834 [subsurface metagenome]
MHYAILGVGAVVLLFFMAKQVQAQAVPVSDIDNQIRIAAIVYGIEPAIVKAVCKVESNFNPRAKNPADPSYGLMQITPGLAYDYGLISDWKNPSQEEIERIYDVYNNLNVGCWFLSRLLDNYAFDQAIQSYNVGERGYFIGRRNYSYLNKVRSAYESYK